MRAFTRFLLFLLLTGCATTRDVTCEYGRGFLNMHGFVQGDAAGLALASLDVLHELRCLTQEAITEPIAPPFI